MEHTLNCSFCEKPVNDNFSEWILWNRNLDGFYVAHKGHCLEMIEERLGGKVEVLSWELDWITNPERYNDMLGSTVCPYVRIIDLLYNLLTYQKKGEVPGLKDVVNDLLTHIKGNAQTPLTRCDA